MEEESSDPFKVRLRFTLKDYIKMAVVGVTLLPLRIFGMLSCFVIAWLLASIGMIGWNVRLQTSLN